MSNFEVLIKVGDNIAPDPRSDVRSYKDGDVICVVTPEHIDNTWLEMLCRGTWQRNHPGTLVSRRADALFVEVTENRRRLLRLTTGAERSALWDALFADGVPQSLGKEPRGEKNQWETWPWGDKERRHGLILIFDSPVNTELARPLYDRYVDGEPHPEARMLAKSRALVPFRSRRAAIGLSDAEIAALDDRNQTVHPRHDRLAPVAEIIDKRS